MDSIHQAYRIEKWDNNFKTDLREVGWGGIDKIHVAQRRDNWTPFVNIIVKLLVL
jgi:hypothetical protein